ncbi:MAG TPA: biopolymer transporter ExbD [Terrimicrobiaceae bacterium]|nr:biopolymer transporter ExbD [Terrimicrobiaceae bacterium]
MKRTEHPQIELQIAPMIDVCFLLLFFYILTSKPVKPEADISMTLPGTVAQEESLEIPDEQRISILQNGQVALNDLPMDEPGSRELPSLFKTLVRFKESADANRSEALITVDAADDSHHQRIVDVLNVCARAGIRGVTFAASEEE